MKETRIGDLLACIGVMWFVDRIVDENANGIGIGMDCDEWLE